MGFLGVVSKVLSMAHQSALLRILLPLPAAVDV